MIKKYFCTINEAISALKKGKMLILVDNPKRENEGDLYISADKVSSKAITQMIRFGGGLICAAITAEQANHLQLPLMVETLQNSEKTKVNFTISVNAKEGITTGVSAFDRCRTIRVLTNPHSKKEDLVRPGHVLGLVAKDGGVLERSGHTEAAVDLSRLANLNPAGVLCEILRDDGRVAKLADLNKLSQKLNIKMVSIDDLVEYLKKKPWDYSASRNKSKVVKTAISKLPTKYGLFEIIIFKSIDENLEHVVLRSKKIKADSLVRLHSKCLTGDTFASLRCDCGDQLQKSMKRIGREGGLILYLNQEGRGVGLTSKIHAYSLQDQGIDTVEANLDLGLPIDARDYQVAAEILLDLGINQIRLLTNNPQKVKSLEKYGIKITAQVSLEAVPNKVNRSYLLAKKHKLGHKLTKV